MYYSEMPEQSESLDTHERTTSEVENSDVRRRDYTEDLRSQYIQLPLAIMLDLQGNRLSYRDVCVYCYLLGRQMNHAKLWWSIESLTALTGIPATGVKESLTKLARSGHIVRERQKGLITTTTRCKTKVEMDAAGIRIVIKGETAVTFERTPRSQSPSPAPSEQSPNGNN